MPRGVVGQNGDLFRDFLPVGVWAENMSDVKQLRNLEEKLCGRPDFFPKTAPSTGKWRFSVFRPEFLSGFLYEFLYEGRPRPKWPKTQYFDTFRPWGSGRPNVGRT